ncbi:MAG TPA: acetylglutamate kinase [Saprospiraceae bacterium]|nr:acetylglutamate kinase [Saprospiraceae bacterium]
MQSLFILKIGGNIIEHQPLLDEALQAFAQLSGLKILIHGGGKRASQLSKQLGIPVQMVHGRRITDAATLEVAVMVYAGLANKQIVAQLQAMGCNAIGMSGADANIIKAQKRPVTDIDYGFAGDIKEVHTEALLALLNSGLTPICCAITHDGQGQLLNTNADTIATQLALAMMPHFTIRLNFCFEKPGVLLDIDNPDSLITEMNQKDYERHRSNGLIADGMLPKLDNAFAALNKGVQEIRISNIEGIIHQKGTTLQL